MEFHFLMNHQNQYKKIKKNKKRISSMEFYLPKFEKRICSMEFPFSYESNLGCVYYADAGQVASKF